jgi:hypothetical protein
MQRNVMAKYTASTRTQTKHTNRKKADKNGIMNKKQKKK